MWLSERKKIKTSENISGKVTISGNKCAVMGYAEIRGLSVLAPGGYSWKPSAGDDVLVFKDGEILGQNCENADLEAGEVCIRSKGGAEIYLCNDGNIYIRGKVITEDEV